MVYHYKIPWDPLIHCLLKYSNEKRAQQKSTGKTYNKNLSETASEKAFHNFHSYTFLSILHRSLRRFFSYLWNHWREYQIKVCSLMDVVSRREQLRNAWYCSGFWDKFEVLTYFIFRIGDLIVSLVQFVGLMWKKVRRNL